VRFEDLGSTVNGVLAAAGKYPGRRAVEDAGIRWTYADLRDQVVTAVRACIAWGIEPGDRVGLCASNSAAWILAALGIQGAGGILIPLNTRFKGDELAYILRAGGVRYVLTEDLAARRSLVREAGGADLAGIRWADMSDWAAWGAFADLSHAVTESEALGRIGALTAADVSDILFTSGTTGYPKGVIFTHGQSLRAYGELGYGFGFTPADRYLLIPPFFTRSATSPAGSRDSCTAAPSFPSGSLMPRAWLTG